MNQFGLWLHIYRVLIGVCTVYGAELICVYSARYRVRLYTVRCTHTNKDSINMQPQTELIHNDVLTNYFNNYNFSKVQR